MANNRYDKVHLSDAQLTNLATGGTIINGSDTYTADETALYLTDEQLDTTPTQNSTNAITSGGVYTALANKEDKITSTNKLSADLIEDGSTNKVFTATEQTKLSGIENGAEANDVTDFQVNGTSVVNNKVGNIVTNTAYDATNNKLATMTDLSGFITNTVDNLTNYYTKSETYTQTEINSLIGGITTITYEIVNSLPTATADTYFNTSKKVYLVAITGGSGTDYYEEYVTVRSGTEGSYTYSWEKIGSTQVDLSNYVDKTTAQTISGTKTFSSSIVSTSGTPILFEGVGSGTYNKGAFVCNTTDGIGFEAPMTTDSASGTKLPITFSWRGGSTSMGGFKVESTGSYEKIGSGSWKKLATTDQIPSATTSINGLSGGKLTSPLQISGGDSATASKIALDQTASGQITNNATQTIFGFTSNNATNLTVGHSSYGLKLRGSGTRPQFNNNDLALYSDIPTVTSTYLSTGTDAVNGTAVASAISTKANSSDLGTQCTFTLSGTTLTITPK